ncbi:MAG: phosphoesterase [Phenylobacterium zucineum]|nr:MAG: phosphoesterase [Phenylobacterium zucineum]
MRPSGALWLEASQTLVVADLHLEKGSAYAARGQLLPPYDSRETLRRLAEDLVLTPPRTLVLLGDSFHDRAGELRLNVDDTRSLSAMALGRSLVWVTGNHDSEGPICLPGDVVEDLKVGALILRHEPLPGRQAGEIAGHLHPCARVASLKGSVRRRCFVTDGERMIVPAFGAYAGGLNILNPAFAGLFAGPVMAGALGRDRVHAVGARALRPDEPVSTRPFRGPQPRKPPP